MSVEGALADIGEQSDKANSPQLDGGDESSRVQVEFLVAPDNVKVEELFASHDPISAVRSTLAARMRFAPNQLILQLRGVDLRDDAYLDSYVSKGETTATINVRIDYRGEANKTPVHMAERIEVKYDPGDGSKPQMIQVAIAAAKQANPFMGGFVHKLTRQVFHHARTQTVNAEREKYREQMDANQRHRETQTVTVKSRSIQSTRESGTQMRRPGLVIDESNDKEVTPRLYVDSTRFHEIHVQKATVIQCFVRYRFACRRALRLLQLRLALTNETQEAQARLKAVEEAKRDMEIQRRMHPKTAADFATLVDELQSWCEHETERIHRTNIGDQETTNELLRDLLDKEVRLLLTIDRLRLSASIVTKRAGERARLMRLAAAKPWKLPSGTIVNVQTPLSVRAREIQELYTGLRLNSINLDERLDILLHVKWTVKQFDTPLTGEIAWLIDREADMLNRGRPVSSLTGLRHRITCLFYRFACTPNFNPQADEE